MNVLFFRFGLNLKALQSFRRSPAIHEYAWVKTEDEANAILRSTRVDDPTDQTEFWDETPA